MADKTTKVQIPGQAGLVDAVEVPIIEATERWSELTLNDGSVLRIKPVVLAAVRVVGQYDQEDNPVYQVKVNQIMTVSAPEHLKKSASSSPKTH